MPMGDYGSLTTGEVRSLSPSFPQPQVTSPSSHNSHGSHSSQSPSQNGSSGTPVGTPGEGRPGARETSVQNSLFYDADSEALSVANGSVGSVGLDGKCSVKTGVGGVGSSGGGGGEPDGSDELCPGGGVPGLGVAGVPGANYWSSLDCSSSDQLTGNAMNSMNGGLNGLNGALSPQAIFQRRAITGGGGSNGSGGGGSGGGNGAGGGGGHSSPSSLVGNMSVCSNGTGSMAGLGGSQGSRLTVNTSGSSNLFGAYSDWSTNSQHGGGQQTTAWSSGNGLAWPPQKRLLNSVSSVSSSPGASAGGTGSAGGLIKSPSQQAVGQPTGPNSTCAPGPKGSIISPSKFRRSTTLPMTKPGFQSFADFQDQDLRSHDIINFQVSIQREKCEKERQQKQLV